MIQKSRKIFVPLCLVCSLLFLLPNFLPIRLTPLPKKGILQEEFDHKLVPQIQSVNVLLFKADSTAAALHVSRDSMAYVYIINELIKNRFYHGYSYYSMRENWIAALAGVTIWSNLSAIVLPDDILKYPMAACSQQVIVLMQCLKRRGIVYREIGFDHHFAMEAKLGTCWYYFDPDVEPDYSVVRRTSIASLIKQKALYTIYKHRFDSAQVDYLLAHQFYGRPNAAPAPQASFFHRITKVLSKTLFLLPLLLCVYVYLKKLRVAPEATTDISIAQTAAF